MTLEAEVDDFLSQHRIALVGVSRDAAAFSNQVYTDLKAKGYHLIPVNPIMQEFQGERCYPNREKYPPGVV
jgi:uncharacterized protein